MKILKVFKMIFVLSLGLPVLAHAGWELYDNFDSQAIDQQKWWLGTGSAIISLENGRAKFVHQPNHPNQSTYLSIRQDPEGVVGVRAKVSFQSCTGDVRARIGGYPGMIGENNVWSGLQLQPSEERIYSNLGVESPPPTYTWLYDIWYGHFQKPIDIVGKTYDISILFLNDKILYEVVGLGKITYIYESQISPPSNSFKGIGTRSTNGDGPCTVYFDDVYVYRK
jgi:hypothetical protein